MRLSIAGSVTAQKRLRRIQKLLIRQGHEVPTQWLIRTFPDVTDTDSRLLKLLAWRDAEDVRNCEILLVDNFTDSTFGGTHTELGIALTLGIPVWVIGSPTNIYHYRADVIVQNWDTALQMLKRMV